MSDQRTHDYYILPLFSKLLRLNEIIPVLTIHVQSSCFNPGKTYVRNFGRELSLPPSSDIIVSLSKGVADSSPLAPSNLVNINVLTCVSPERLVANFIYFPIVPRAQRYCSSLDYTWPEFCFSLRTECSQVYNLLVMKLNDYYNIPKLDRKILPYHMDAY